MSPADPPSPYFHATIQGAVEAEFEGTGTVGWGGGWEGVYNFNLGAFSEDWSQYFWLQIYQRSIRAPEGTYAVTFRPRLWLIVPGRDDTAVRNGWVPVLYFKGWTEGPREDYVAEAGTIEITRSWHADLGSYMKDRGDGWVEGRFSISAVRYCGRGEGDYCVHVSELPDQLPAHLPRIQVTGSFVATVGPYTIPCCHPDSP